MKIRRTLSLCGLVACLPAAVQAVDPEYVRARDRARELISAMKLDEQAEQKVEGQILRRCQVEKCDADLRECLLKKPDHAFLLARVNSDLQRELTPAEIRQAIDYFRSETGLKHLDILRAEQNLGGNDTLFNQTPEVRARILAFLDTRAGYLLITRAVLSKSVNDSISGQVFEAFSRCEPKSPT